jgi:hypothetical protein
MTPGSVNHTYYNQNVMNFSFANPATISGLGIYDNTSAGSLLFACTFNDGPRTVAANGTVSVVPNDVAVFLE